MNIFKKPAIVTVLVVTAVSFTGCDWFDNDESDPGARETIQAALQNMYDVETYKYNITVTGDFDSETDSGDFVLKLYGEEDYRDSVVPKFNLKISAEGNIGGISGKLGDIELRFDGVNVYVMLSNLSDFGGTLPAKASASFVDKWWKIPVPAESFEEVLVFSDKKDPTELTDEELKMRKMVEELTLLTDIKNTEIMNDRVRFDALLNKDEFKDYVKSLAQLSQGPLEKEEAEEFDNFLNALDVGVEVWVSEKDNLIHRFVANVSLDDEGTKFNVVADAEMVAFDEEVTVEIPAKSEEFDPLMLLGLAGGLQQ